MVNALITGGTKGIGYCIVKNLNCHENNIYTTYFHDDKLAKNLELEGINPIKLDMTNLDSIDYLIKGIKKLDCVIFNFAETDRSDFCELKENKWDLVIDSILKVPLFTLQKLIKLNLVNNNSNIIFIGSILGRIPDGVSFPYSIAKSALPMMVKKLAKELASKGIRVNLISPGFINTDWHKGKNKEQIKRIRDKILVNRFGAAEEITKTVIHVIENEYINGQEIIVDGGYGL